MLKLGKVISKKSSTVISIYKFDFEHMQWSNNNNGEVCEKGTVCDKAQAFVHFTHEKSEGKLIVLDIQGAGYTLYDPEIASLHLVNDDGTYQFCTGNLSEIAMKKFFEKHQCNKYCKLLGLKSVPS